MLPSRRGRTACSALMVAFAVAGCAGAMPVGAPAPTGEAAAACTALTAGLPTELLGLERRATDPESPFTAAWGEPAVTLRCGVAQPGQLTPTSELVSVGGPGGPTVDWLPTELTQGFRFTTTGRVAYVEVDVPRDYAPEVNALIALADPVAAAVPTVDDVSEGRAVEPSPS